MRSWQFVRRQRLPACGVHVYGGVCVAECDIERVHGDSGNLRTVSRRQLVRWWRGPTHSMLLRGRVLCAWWCRCGLRGFNSVVRGVYGRQFVRRQRCPGSAVRVRCGARIDQRGIECVHDDDGNVCAVSRRCFVRWWRGRARCVHL